VFRHIEYGTLAEHYAVVGNALLYALEKFLGDKWTPAVKEAWTWAFTLIANTMIKGAEKAEAQAKKEHCSRSRNVEKS